jgi:hypothetical protein
MFTTKKQSLFASQQTSDIAVAPFIKAGLKKSAETLSGNGALKYTTTGNDFVDQFAKLGLYKQPRSADSIFSDTSILWAKNPRLTMCFILFIRMITRVISFFSGERTLSVQRGSGLKHEGIMRMIWVHIFHKDIFWKNIQLFISAGSWKDVFVMLQYDLMYNGWKDRKLSWEQFGKLILAGLENPNTSELVKKYLPQIRANSQCKTIESQADSMIAKWICSLLFGNKKTPTDYKMYRKLKTSGTAHQWQQLISQGKHTLINFDTVHGKALSQLVSGKYLANQGLETKYEEWIASKPIAKYTGYVVDLFVKKPQKKYQIDTLNAQFMGLVETAKQNAVNNTGMIVVRDTSASMGAQATGTKLSCFDIGKALALFFSYMLPGGKFANSWIEFNSVAKMHQWKGSTPYEKWQNDASSYVGSTNFLSVISLFIQIKSQGISENEFPTGIICISDSEFNPATLNQSNVKVALDKLRSAGFSEDYVSNFKIVLWNLQSNYYGSTTGSKFETYGNVENVYYFSGYDPSIIAFLTGTTHQTSTPKTAEELFIAAMDQEIMSKVEI